MQIIVKITVLIALGIILNGCGKSEPLAELEEPSVIVAPTIDAPMLDGEGLGDMVVEIYNEHQRLTIELLKRYNQYKKTSDFHNYTFWRHEHWQPQYDKKNAYYAA